MSSKKERASYSSLLEIVLKLQKEVCLLKEQNESMMTRIAVLEEEKKIRDQTEVVEYIYEHEVFNEDPEFEGEEEEGEMVEETVEEVENVVYEISSILSEEQRVQLEKVVGGDFNSTKWKRIFQASKNHFSGRRFHKKCDNTNNTLIIVQTEKGRVMGGFNPFLWNQMKGYFHSSGSWIFGFDDKNVLKKFEYNENGKGIYHNPRHGPIFGGGQDLCIFDKCDKADNFVDQGFKESSYTVGTLGRYFLNGGKRKFLVKEYEVFVRKE